MVETGHLQPPLHMTEDLLGQIQDLVPRVLDCLGIRFGASHTELKIDENGKIRIIECGGRMGGDCIGSDLVYISRGVDFVGACVDVSCGKAPDLRPKQPPRISAIRFIFNQRDLDDLEYLILDYYGYDGTLKDLLQGRPEVKEVYDKLASCIKDKKTVVSGTLPYSRTAERKLLNGLVEAGMVEKIEEGEI